MFKPAVRPKALHRHLPAETRFFAQVDREPTDPVAKAKGCWLWTGAKDKNGYGRIRVNGRQMHAHVFSWEIRYCPMPPGKWGLHTCDNPSCVNPEHVYPGTPQANVQDRMEHGRAMRGEENHKAKLTAEQVKSIRAAWEAGQHNKSEIARQYNVTNMLVGKIIRRELWKHI